MKYAVVICLLILSVFSIISCSKSPSENPPIVAPPTDTTSTPPATSSGIWKIDTAFNLADTFVSAGVVQTDGKIIISTRTGIRRLNKDGTRDISYDSGYISDGEILCMAIQTDGKVLVGGNYTKFKSETKVGIIRLNTDGTIDKSFNANVFPGDIIYSIGLQSTGKIIVGGHFSIFDNQGSNGRSHIARLNIDGTIDLTFNNFYTPGSYSAVVANIFVVKVLPEDNMYIGGYQMSVFDTINRVTEDLIAKLDKNGYGDPTFVYDQGGPTSGYAPYGSLGIYAVEEESNKNVMMGGNFLGLMVNGKTASIAALAWLSTDGKLMPDYNKTGYANFVRSIISLADGSYFIGGSACRLITYDGYIDSTYNLKYPQGVIYNMVKESEKSVLLMGKLYFGNSNYIGMLRLKKD